jgi:hypothetical protein
MAILNVGSRWPPYLRVVQRTKELAEPRSGKVRGQIMKATWTQRIGIGRKEKEVDGKPRNHLVVSNLWITAVMANLLFAFSVANFDCSMLCRSQCDSRVFAAAIASDEFDTWLDASHNFVSCFAWPEDETKLYECYTRLMLAAIARDMLFQEDINTVVKSPPIPRDVEVAMLLSIPRTVLQRVLHQCLSKNIMVDAAVLVLQEAYGIPEQCPYLKKEGSMVAHGKYDWSAAREYWLEKLSGNPDRAE